MFSKQYISATIIIFRRLNRHNVRYAVFQISTEILIIPIIKCVQFNLSLLLYLASKAMLTGVRERL